MCFFFGLAATKTSSFCCTTFESNRTLCMLCITLFLKEHILSAKDNTRQLHRNNCLSFICFAINALHQHLFVLVCRCWSRRWKKSKTFPQNSRSCSTAASIMKCEMCKGLVYTGVVLQQMRLFISFLYSVFRLFFLCNKWLHSELKRDPFKPRATLLSIL